MKRLLLTLVAIVALAAPAFAYVQSGHLPEGKTAQSGAPSPDGSGYNGAVQLPGDTEIGPPIGHLDERAQDDTPVHPVPEPGTMALASMGLLALGAAARKRHRR